MIDPRQTELKERERYVKALAELLATLPPEEVVDNVILGNNTVNRHGFRRRSAEWTVATVSPIGDGSLKRTFWRGYFSNEHQCWRLSNVGSQNEVSPV